ncbi:MAG: hypothetical protein ACOZF0_06730 [Thermodesulfobacteriota bacterium]
MMRTVLTGWLAIAVALAAGAAFGDGISYPDDIAIHGFVSQGYMQSTDNNFFAETETGTFELNEMGINFITQMPEYHLRVGIQLFARDLGQIGNDEVFLDWAVAEYRWRDWLGFAAGKMKVPHGLYNETRDVDMLRTNIFLPQSVYNESWRDVIAANKGVGVFGNLPLMKLGRLAYRAQIGTVEIDSQSGPALHFNDQVPRDIPIAVQEVEVERGDIASLQWLSPGESLRLGCSYWALAFIARMDTTALPLQTDFSLDAKSFTLSAEYTWKNLILAAEYSRIDWEIQPTNSQVLNVTPDFVPEFYTQGYYGSAVYRLTSFFETGVYYAEYYPDDFDRDGNNQEFFHRAWLKDACLSTRFDLNDNWIAKLEGHFMNGTAILLNADNPDGYGTNPHWFLFAAKITFSF